MWSGTSTLNNIDKALQSIRNEIIRLDSELSSLTSKQAASERQQLKIINDIAKVRLLEIDKGNLQAELTAADLEAADILNAREEAFAKVSSDIDITNKTLEQAEQQREALLTDANKLSEKISIVEAEVQAGLKKDTQYMQQLAQAQKTSLTAEQAWNKAKQAEADLAQKARPYQQDKLFMYLWERGFGTAQFKGNFLTKWLDGWVAGLINYAPARVNFWNLNEIPKRLTEHATRLSHKADAEKISLQKIELAAISKSQVPGLEKELEILQNKLDQHDDKIEQHENELNRQLEQRAAFIAGEDDYIKRCLSRLTQDLQHQDLQSIHRYVRETLSPADDKLVMELQNIQNANRDITSDLKDARDLHDKKITRLKELEKVRRDFKSYRFDDVRSGFGNESLLANMLQEFLGGLINGGQLWDVLRRSQRYRDIGSLPDFGSGSLGDIFRGGTLGQGGSSWHWPKPRHGGGFRIPRGGGGFRTGGSF